MREGLTTAARYCFVPVLPPIVHWRLVGAAGDDGDQGHNRNSRVGIVREAPSGFSSPYALLRRIRCGGVNGTNPGGCGYRLPPAPMASPCCSPIRTPIVSKARPAPVRIRGVIREGTPKSRPVIVGTVIVGFGVIGSRVVGRRWRKGTFNVGARRVRPEIGRARCGRRQSEDDARG